MDSIKIKTTQRCQMLDITKQIQNIIESNHLTMGLVVVYVPHTTAAVTINEGADPSVQHDIITTLNRLIPENNHYAHTEGNSDAHVKASLLSPSITIPVENTKMLLGTWQHIFLVEGDGPRTRTVHISCVRAA